MVALLLVALFPATDLPPSETYLFYAYCVLVIRAWTYEYAQGRMSIQDPNAWKQFGPETTGQ